MTKWIEPFGVLAFESEYDISKKIEASDGEPTFIGKPYNVEINGQIAQPTDANNTRFFAKAVMHNGITYMPVVPIAKILRLKLEWHKGESTLKSRFGKVVCYEKKDQLYCNADDAPVLFNIEGGLQTNSDGVKIFRFKSLPVTEKPIVEPKPNKPDKNTPTVDKPQDTPQPEVKPQDKISSDKVDKPFEENKSESGEAAKL